MINRNTRRNVTLLKLSDGEHPKTFFMKRFFNPHFKDMLFTLRNFGKICSQAELEWRNANIFLDNGIETYHPVCYGFRSVCGIERQSFFVTEEIDGCCLLDYLMDSWKILPPADKEMLVIKLAKFFRKIHSAGLSLPDSYIWHVYMVNTSNETDDYEFGMIDLHRMQIRTRGNRPAAMNLGRFLFSLPEGFMDAHLQSLFLENYLNTDFFGNKKAFIDAVKKWEAKISKRRKKTVTSLTS
ncbi:MAG: hypothetical protein ISS71_08020 [Phycisphaerae bacterium]|nr:hypothetical protein [Phycisphaerae bacterium]